MKRLFNYCEKQPHSRREAKSLFIFVLLLRDEPPHEPDKVGEYHRERSEH